MRVTGNTCRVVGSNAGKEDPRLRGRTNNNETGSEVDSPYRDRVSLKAHFGQLDALGEENLKVDFCFCFACVAVCNATLRETRDKVRIAPFSYSVAEALSNHRGVLRAELGGHRVHLRATEHSFFGEPLRSSDALGFGWLRSLPLNRSGRSRRTPEGNMQGGNLILDGSNRTNDGDVLLTGGENGATRKIHGGVFFVITSELEKPTLSNAINNATNIGPVLRPGTHGAWLGRGEKGAGPEHFWSKVCSSVSKECGLSVIDAVHVALLHQHRFAIRGDQQGSEWVFSKRQCPLCHFIGSAQMLLDLSLCQIRA
mmetsp:Transcript_57090/g.124097  ORF Transcript_57090/g.124097 Transcript_57090/m.124097 type:complete len:312 (-) Transcript_57090:47-982(-)